MPADNVVPPNVPPKMSRRAQGAQTKEAILDAALELFAAAGYRGTGLMAIGERAGVTHPTVLYHYGSAYEILLAVLRERDRRVAEQVSTAFDAGGLDGLRNLPAIARFNVENPELARLFMVLQGENLHPESEAHEYFLVRRRDVRDGLVRLLREADDEGRLRPDVDIATVAEEIMAFTSGAQLQHCLDPETFDLVAVYTAYTEALIEDLTRGARRKPTPKPTPKPKPKPEPKPKPTARPAG